MFKEMTATVEGIQEHSEDKRPFKEELTFILLPPKDSNHYGTGYYMRVIVKDSDGKTENKHLVDVRYERTTDVEILADRWIKNWYGNNAKSVSKCFQKGIL